MEVAEKKIETNESSPKLFKVLVYGIERLGYATPENEIKTSNISITFAPFDTELKFQDFDGVILFQGIWATWKSRESLYGDSDEFLTGKQNDMLRVRIKQLQALIAKGGFITFLMGRMVQDDFDLAKEVLSWFREIYFDPTPDNEFFRKVYFNELINYFNSDYGVSKTKYKYFGEADYRVIADIAHYDGDVSIVLQKKYFYIPCHAIRKDEANVQNLFRTLVPSLVATFKKLNQELPKWVNDFKFITESKLDEEKEKVEERMSEIQKELVKYENYKMPLILTDKLLAESVVDLFKDGIGLEVTGKDSGYEDIQMWDKPESEKGSVIAVIEAKGVNGNVNRDAINQVDDHKERNGFSSDFPGILIVNTFIKSSNSMENKDKPVEQEQINHAIKMNVLVLRTLDLVRAYDLILSGVLKVTDFQGILLSEKGWLEIKEGKIVIHNQAK